MKKGKLKEMLSYGVGAVGLDLSYGLFYSYLAKYLTDILHLNKNDYFYGTVEDYLSSDIYISFSGGDSNA
jgi:hypothetical protein